MADIYSTTMLDAIRKSEIRVGTFFQDKFFGRDEIISTLRYEYDVISGGGDLAPCVSVSSASRAVTSSSYENKGFANLYRYAPADIVTPEKLEQRLPGFTEYDSPDKIAELQNISFADLNDRILNSREFAAVKSLTTGVASAPIDETGSQTVALAQFWDAVGGTTGDPVLTISSGDRWDVSGRTGGDIIRAIQAWKNEIIRHKGSAPRTLVLSPDVADILQGVLADSSTKESLVDAGALDTAGAYADEGILPLGRLCGLEVYTCVASFGGSDLIPAGSAILGSTGKSVNVFGPTYLPGASEMSPAIKAIGKMSMYTHCEGDPVVYKNILQCAHVPVIRRKWDALYIKSIIG